MHARKSLHCLADLLVGIWTLKVILIKSDKDGNKEHIGSWRKDSPCYKVAKNFAELCSRVLWKMEVKSDELDI